MTLYSEQLAQDYSQKRHNYCATDAIVFSHIDRIGVANKKVLDFGCGDGVYVQKFLDKGAEEVFGIDESEKMIEIANMKYGSLSNVKFKVADGNHLPFESYTFDMVFANFVLHHFDDTLQPLSEIYRVLKGNSYLIATLNVYDISENLDVPLNTQVPIKLGTGNNTILVHNTLKPYMQIEKDLKSSNFIIELYAPIDNSDAKIDESCTFKNKVTLMPMIIVAKKQ